MFFTRLARLIALLGLILGGLRLATAFFVASIDDVEARTIAIGRYLGNPSRTTGHYIDEATSYMLVAIALGVLA